jgi:ankyrin repeat protein
MFYLFVLHFLYHNARADYPWGYSPPMYYSRRSQTTPIISLDLDPKDEMNSSFRIAVREDRLDSLEKLIKAGADLNSQSDRQETALMYACRNCSPKVVEFLLHHGADVNLRDEKGRTALMFATRGSCVEVVKLLLAFRLTRVNLQDNRGRLAMDYAKDASILEVDGPSIKIIHLLQRFKNTSIRPNKLKKNS